MTPQATLVISRYGPHQTGGAALRNFQNIRGLGRLGPVDVLTLSEDPREGRVAVDGVREWQRFAIRGARASMLERLRAQSWRWRPGIHPVLEGYRVSAAEGWLRERTEEYSYRWVVIEELALARYGEISRSRGCRVIFDAHNVEGTLRAELAGGDGGDSEGWLRRVRKRVLASRLMAEERRAVCGADQVWACSAMDAKTLSALYGSRAAVVPNAVEVDAYRRDSAAEDGDWDGNPLTLLFTGSFSYIPNSDAAMRLIGEVLPLVRRRHPNARLWLVGRNPSAAMLLAAKADPAIVVTGAVSSVLPYLHAEAIVVVPLTVGSGTRLKILEAFAAGTPVVSTAKGAEGIDAKDGHHLLLREEPAAIASAAVELWEDASLRGQLVFNAGLLVASHYSWEVAAQRIASSLGVPVRDGLAAGTQYPSSS